ncbi:MAG: ATP-binding protein [Patescibacteria group bacterium]
MICLKVTVPTSGVVVNSFPDDFTVPKQESQKNKKSRYFRKNTSFGILEFLLIEEERVANSNKVFNAFVVAIETALEKSISHNLEKAREMADDYLHNIIKIHGNQKSIVERCVFGAEGQESYTDFVSVVKENVQRNPDMFAEDICALSKEIRLVDYHIGGYNLLRDASSRVTITDNHNLKKFLLGLSHLFFEFFRKNNVVVSLHDISESFLCSFEYETFNIAMHSFLENTVKYSKPYSRIIVYTRTESGELIFQMESVRIEKDEIIKIFERGVFGRCVPEDLRGSGIGMYQLKKALDRSRISVTVSPDHSQSSEVNGVRYTKNTFSFRFPKYSN